MPNQTKTSYHSQKSSKILDIYNPLKNPINFVSKIITKIVQLLNPEQASYMDQKRDIDIYQKECRIKCISLHKSRIRRAKPKITKSLASLELSYRTRYFIDKINGEPLPDLTGKLSFIWILEEEIEKYARILREQFTTFNLNSSIYKYKSDSFNLIIFNEKSFADLGAKYNIQTTLLNLSESTQIAAIFNWHYNQNQLTKQPLKNLLDKLAKLNGNSQNQVADFFQKFLKDQDYDQRSAKGFASKITQEKVLESSKNPRFC